MAGACITHGKMRIAYRISW